MQHATNACRLRKPQICSVADGSTMQGVATATLSINGLTPLSGTHYPSAPTTLISLPQLLDEHGGAVTLTRDEATYTQNGKVVWTAQRTAFPGVARKLWTVALGNKTEDHTLALASRSYQHKVWLETEQDLVNFVSSVLGNPPQSTFLQAIRLGLRFPGLSLEKARRSPPHSIHTPRGHLRASPKGYHSSKPKAKKQPAPTPHALSSEGGNPEKVDLKIGDVTITITTTKAETRATEKPTASTTATALLGAAGSPDDADSAESGDESDDHDADEPAQPQAAQDGDEQQEADEEPLPDGIHTRVILGKDMRELIKLYGDFTGRLDKPSFDEHVAFMVFFHSKANYIKIEPVRAGHAPSEAYQRAYNFFKQKNCTGDWFIADNAVPDSTRKWFEKKNVKVQIVPPNQHRANAAERAIQTFKAHFITILDGVSKSFPWAFWHHLADQAEWTLNMLRPSRANPDVSAYEHVYGEPWDFDKQPMMPLGTKCVALKPKEVRTSWGLHTRDGFYIGPARHSYRCYKIVLTSGKVIHSDTVEWFPEDVILPGATNEEQLREVLGDLHTAIERINAQDNERLTVSKPKMVAILEELLDIYHPNGPQAHKPCPACGKQWSDNVKDEWTQCDDCPLWFCSACVTAGKLKDHAHTHAAKSEGAKAPLAPPPGLPAPLQNAQPKPALAAPAQASEGAAPPTETPKDIEKQRYQRPSKAVQQPTQPEKPKRVRFQEPAGNPYEREYSLRKPIRPAAADMPHDASSTKPVTPIAIGVNRRSQSNKASTPAPPSQTGAATRSRARPPTTPAPTALSTALLAHTDGGTAAATDGFQTVASRKKRGRKAQATHPKASPSRSPSTVSSGTSSNPTTGGTSSAFLSARAANEAEEIWKESELYYQELLKQVDIHEGFAIEDALKSGHIALGAKVLDAAGNQLKYSKASTGSEGAEWQAACDSEWHRNIETYESMHFVDACPTDRKMAYLRQVLETNKEGKKRVRGTVGGDASDLQFNVWETSSRNASMTMKKLFMNAALSEHQELYTGDARDFYINKMNKLAVPVYVKVFFNQLGPETVAKYDLEQWRQRGYVVLKVVLAVYGLEESSAIAQNNLVDYAKTLGYTEMEQSEKTMVFRHKDPSVSTSFLLHTDDFQIKAPSKSAAAELITALESAGYVINMNWEPTTYCGLTIHYKKGEVLHLDQPGYSELNLERSGFSDVPLQHTPLPAPAIVRGKHTPMTPKPDTAPPMSAEQVAIARKFLGGTLWQQVCTRNDFTYANSMLISELKSPTLTTWERIKHFAGYIRAKPLLGVTFWPSDMKLEVFTDSDFSSPYSRTGGFFHLARNDEPNFINGPILCLSKLQPIATAAANEAEYVGMFMNGKTSLPVRQELTALGYPQEATLFKGDNKVAIGIATDTVQQRRSKYVDSKFHWFRDRCRRVDFKATWISTETNIADMFTKALARIPFNALLPFVARSLPCCFHSTQNELNQ